MELATILAGNVNKRFSTTLTSLAVVSCKILVSFVLKLLSLSKSAITSHTCMLYELRYDNDHLYVMSCLLTTWYFIISSWFLHIKSRCCISTIPLKKYNKSSAVADMGDRLATTVIGRKVGSPGPLPWRGELSPHNIKAYFRIKWHPGSSSRLATIDMGRKMGDCVPFRRGQLGPRLTQCCLGRGLPPYQVADWPQQTWTEKWGLLYPFFGEAVPI